MRQRDEDVFFLTGTDEHGEPVADAAHAQGVAPQDLADRNAERFKALAPRLDASNDFFIRTSDEEHGKRVQEVLQRVHDNGYTYKGMYEGWYCPRCADFKVENEILEGNRCPIHEIVLERHQEENWFFQLSAFQGRLEEPFEVMDQYSTDALRFYLMRDVSFGGDGAVGMDAVRSRYEAELANEYGNLASRTIAMIQRYRDGVIPTAPTDRELAREFEVLPA